MLILFGCMGIQYASLNLLRSLERYLHIYSRPSKQALRSAVFKVETQTIHIKIKGNIFFSIFRAVQKA